MNLTTEYLGLKLKNPLMPGASPMVDNLDMVRRLEDAGASAIVMHSLFEEQINMEDNARLHHVEMHTESYGEALGYLPKAEDFPFVPDQYLDQIARLKAAVSVPVIASLNGVTIGGWIEYAKGMQQAGADAMELNFYEIPTDPEEPALEVENRAIEILTLIKENVSIPVAVVAVFLVIAALRRSPRCCRGRRAYFLQPVLPARHRHRGTRRAAKPPAFHSRRAQAASALARHRQRHREYLVRRKRRHPQRPRCPQGGLRRRACRADGECPAQARP